MGKYERTFKFSTNVALAGNGSQLAEVADFVTANFQLKNKYNA
jgi:hypothetical protein